MDLLNWAEKQEVSPEKLTQFISYLCKLDELEIIGLTNLMGIKIVDQDNKPRTFDEVLSELIDGYLACNRQKRRKIDYVLNEVVNGKDKGDVHRGRVKKKGRKQKKH